MKGKSINRSKAAARSKLGQRILIGGGLIITLAVMAIGGQWRTLLHRSNHSGSVSPATAAASSTSKPSKEYIYGGGRLIATEEPDALTMPAPASLVAASTSNSRVDISWGGTPGADHYQVERSPNINAAYSILSSNVLSTNFSDTNVTPVSAYLYRVRAVDALGGVSPYSSVDVATAITFTDDPLQANSTLIKAQHIWELRQAVNAVRATANLPAVVWTDNVASAGALVGIRVQAVHIEELRTRLDEALAALGLPVSPYTDPVPPGLRGILIQKIHIDQLRQRVK